ncbi:UDP-3-O-(3-hydroxymyristoyl)glucosamine N-acyltransferase [Roseiconus nitratireducens]|uniref:UDP-3-O-(3-hydroxymyristoyl)glucosamine N-acyltransferase n=1 Tax=Roseiconus nitratireducens TaxID=2605748 RepID=UPI001F33DB59|nr:UDP-3-O-(3-hydroxymyristoyl)glucosamine N-acyltransferase [Roseiconus nitratireducens]
MEIRLDELARLLGGTLKGDPTLICRGANPPGQAAADEVTMILEPQRREEMEGTEALAVIVTGEIESLDRAQILVEDPHQALATAVKHFRPPIELTLPPTGIAPGADVAASARIHPSATIGKGVKIGHRSLIMPGVVIMPGCVIGDDCVLHAGVTLYEYTQLADRVVVHAGTVIGANGFGYRQEQGRHVPKAQLGYVRIESDVEIGACVTIDRGSYGPTQIGEGTKIDNQVMIAHNCQIGRHNLICSQVGIAGSCRTGDYVVLAGQVGLKDHITLGDHAIVGAQAGVMDDCDGDQVYLGSPAMPQRDQMQIFALQRKLPEMRRELKTLRKQLAVLEQRLNSDPAETVDGANGQPDADTDTSKQRAA